MDMSTAYLYVIVNKKNKKKYIGVTSNPPSRWDWHKETAKTSDKPLYKDMRKYGLTPFFFSVIATGPRWVMGHLERALIAQWKTRIPKGYNIAPGGFSRKRK